MHGFRRNGAARGSTPLPGNSSSSPAAATARFLSIVLILALPLSCSLWLAPEVSEGRSRSPDQELLVVHSLAETLTSVTLTGAGRFSGTDDDLVQLGSVPNDIVATGHELVITLSGENRLLFLDQERLLNRDPVDLGTGINPMRTVLQGPDPQVFATTGFFTSRVYLYDREGTEMISPSKLETGRAPQAILVLSGSDKSSSAFRLVTADTGYSSSRPSDSPFAPGTLSEFSLTLGGSSAAPEVTLEGTRRISLEAEGHDPDADSGLNPVALVDMHRIDAAIEELLVLGAGVNYGGSGGSGEDDGTVLVLDRDTLEITQRIELGGSPGAALVQPRDDGGFVLFAAGTDGVRALRRGPGASGTWETTPSTVYTASGGRPFLADITARGDQVYVADFGNNRVLRFRHTGDGKLSGPLERIDVSDGPVALLVRGN